LIEIGLLVLEKKIFFNINICSGEEVENVKVYRQTGNQNSSLELSAQVS
jgi:hypothetical protein